VKTKNLVPYIVGLVVTGFVVFLAYLIFFMPRIAEAQAIQKSTTDQRILNDQQSAKVSAVLEKAGNLSVLLDEGKAFHTSFPQGASQKDLFDSVMAAGAQAGVTVAGVTASLPAAVEEPVAEAAPASGAAVTADSAPAAPAAPAAPPAPGESDSPLAAVALTINASGEQENLKAFLARLEEMRRPIQVESFTLTSVGGEPTLQVTAESYLTAPLPEPSS
jgi:Tfp pilus assembly protein PilO